MRNVKEDDSRSRHRVQATDRGVDRELTVKELTVLYRDAKPYGRDSNRVRLDGRSI